MRAFLGAIVLGSIVGTVAPSPAKAQQAPLDTSVVHIEHGAIDSAFQAIESTPAVFFRDLATGDATRYQLVIVSRRAEAAAELHEHWSDVVWVRAGRAVLRTARGLQQRQSAGPGEWTGAIGPQAQQRTIAAGDILVIPAGLAHQWRPHGSYF